MGVGLRRVVKGGGPEWWEPRRLVSRRLGSPKFRFFFFPFPTPIFIHSSLSWGSSRGILVVFEAPGPSNVHVWSVPRKGGPARARSAGGRSAHTNTHTTHTHRCRFFLSRVFLFCPNVVFFVPLRCPATGTNTLPHPQKSKPCDLGFPHVLFCCILEEMLLLR